MTSDLRHFAPYGSTNALCDETVPRGSRMLAGEYVDDRFTVQRDRVTCPDCRYGLTLVGDDYPSLKLHGLPTLHGPQMLTEDELAEARRIREAVSPMLRADGKIDSRAVAQESTLRARAGLPGWIAALDAPGRVALRHTDAARIAAPREETVIMAEGTTEKRESWDEASKRGSTIAQFATMDPSDAARELESRSVNELRQLAHDASMNEGWHLQGAADSRVVRERIGQVLRSASQDADPEYGQAVAAESIRR